MADEIIEELWKIKDSIGQEHGYDVDTVVAYLKEHKNVQWYRIKNLQLLSKNTEPNNTKFVAFSKTIRCRERV